MAMRKIVYKGRFIFIPVAAFAFLSLVSFIVMQLWNHLLPEILHTETVNFWQAMGIFILCKILFGFGKGGPGMKNRLREKFRQMDPQERERFRAEMKERMCNWRKSGFDQSHPANQQEEMTNQKEN